MLESKNSKDTIKFGLNNLSEVVVSYRQVQQLLECGSSAWLPNKEATFSDLKCLSSALLDSLQDKSVALAHFKKTNKLLASRIVDLEQQQDPHCLKQQISSDIDIESTPISWLSPSQILLKGYSASEVDNVIIEQEDDHRTFPKATDLKYEKICEKNSSSIYDRYSDIQETLPPHLKHLFIEALNEVEKCST